MNQYKRDFHRQTNNYKLNSLKDSKSTDFIPKTNRYDQILSLVYQDPIENKEQKQNENELTRVYRETLKKLNEQIQQGMLQEQQLTLLNQQLMKKKKDKDQANLNFTPRIYIQEAQKNVNNLDLKKGEKKPLKSSIKKEKMTEEQSIDEIPVKQSRNQIYEQEVSFQNESVIPQFQFYDKREQKKFEKIAEVLKNNQKIIENFQQKKEKFQSIESPKESDKTKKDHQISPIKKNVPNSESGYKETILSKVIRATSKNSNRRKRSYFSKDNNKHLKQSASMDLHQFKIKDQKEQTQNISNNSNQDKFQKLRQFRQKSIEQIESLKSQRENSEEVQGAKKELQEKIKRRWNEFRQQKIKENPQKQIDLQESINLKNLMDSSINRYKVLHKKNIFSCDETLKQLNILLPSSENVKLRRNSSEEKQIHNSINECSEYSEKEISLKEQIQLEEKKDQEFSENQQVKSSGTRKLREQRSVITYSQLISFRQVNENSRLSTQEPPEAIFTRNQSDYINARKSQESYNCNDYLEQNLFEQQRDRQFNLYNNESIQSPKSCRQKSKENLEKDCQQLPPKMHRRNKTLIEISKMHIQNQQEKTTNTLSSKTKSQSSKSSQININQNLQILYPQKEKDEKMQTFGLFSSRQNINKKENNETNNKIIQDRFGLQKILSDKSIQIQQVVPIAAETHQKDELLIAKQKIFEQQNTINQMRKQLEKYQAALAIQGQEIILLKKQKEQQRIFDFKNRMIQFKRQLIFNEKQRQLKLKQLQLLKKPQKQSPFQDQQTQIKKVDYNKKMNTVNRKDKNNENLFEHSPILNKQDNKYCMILMQKRSKSQKFQNDNSQSQPQLFQDLSKQYFNQKNNFERQNKQENIFSCQTYRDKNPNLNKEDERVLQKSLSFQDNFNNIYNAGKNNIIKQSKHIEKNIYQSKNNIATQRSLYEEMLCLKAFKDQWKKISVTFK